MAAAPPPPPPPPPLPRRVGTLYARGSAKDVISDEELAAGLKEALSKLDELNELDELEPELDDGGSELARKRKRKKTTKKTKQRVLLLPPDITRRMSKAGELACAAHAFYGDALVDVMPTLGTHRPMTPEEIADMYPTIPAALFREHDWRADTVEVGRVPAETVAELTNGAVAGESDWVATLNKLVAEGGHDLILSVGQVRKKGGRKVAPTSHHLQRPPIIPPSQERIRIRRWLSFRSCFRAPLSFFPSSSLGAWPLALGGGLAVIPSHRWCRTRLWAWRASRRTSSSARRGPTLSTSRTTFARCAAWRTSWGAGQTTPVSDQRIRKILL